MRCASGGWIFSFAVLVTLMTLSDCRKLNKEGRSMRAEPSSNTTSSSEDASILAPAQGGNAAERQAVGGGEGGLLSTTDPRREPSPTDSYAGLVIVTTLIILSIFIAFSIDVITKSVDPVTKPMLMALYREVTILGFLGLVTFVLEQTRALDDLQKRVYPKALDEEDNILYKIFESIHMMLFFIMILFLLQRYRNFETASNATKGKLVLKGYLDEPTVGWRREQLDYALMRHRFINTMNSFLPKGHALGDSFDFSRYLWLCLCKMMAKLIEIGWISWLVVLLGIAIMTFAMTNESREVAKWAFLSLSGIFLLFGVALVVNVRSIKAKLQPTQNPDEHVDLWPLPPPYIAKGEQSLKELEGVTHGFLGLNGGESGRQHQGGATGHRASMHSQLFWFGHHGPHALVLMLTTLLFSNMILLVTWIAYMVFHLPWYLNTVFGICLILTAVVLPAYLISDICLITSVEMMKDQELIAAVQLEARTKATNLALKVLFSLKTQAVEAFEAGDHEDVKEKTVTSDVEVSTKRVNGAQIVAEFIRGDATAEKALEEEASRETRRKNAQAMFDRFDVDHSGTIEENELAMLLHAVDPASSIETSPLTKILRKHGNVTFEAFFQYLERLRMVNAISPRAFASLIFDMLPVGVDGNVPVTEFGDWLQNNAEKLTREDVQEIVRQVDSDDSGTISSQEFFEFLNKNSFFDE